MAAPDPTTLDAIRRMAKEYGISPATALAFAERESGFNVRGTSGSPLSSAKGLFQLLRAERAQYGGDTWDPHEQASAWGRYIQPAQKHLTKVLGRAPTGPELYMAHLIGYGRAARIVSGQMDPNTPISDVMTPRELAANPFMVKAGTTGRLASSVMGDMARREAKWGGAGQDTGLDYAAYGQPVDMGFDYAQYGQAEGEAAPAAPAAPAAAPKAPAGIDYGAYGVPA